MAQHSEPVHSMASIVDRASPLAPATVPIIFLECDGVLATYRCIASDFDEGEPELIHCADAGNAGQTPLERRLLQNLKFVVDATGAHIVLTTTWRAVPEMREFLALALASIGISPDAIIDDTEHLPDAGRGGEVRRWLDKHPQFVDYVVFDEDRLGYEDDTRDASYSTNNLQARLIKTLMRASDPLDEGLTRAKAERAIQMLTNRP